MAKHYAKRIDSDIVNFARGLGLDTNMVIREGTEDIEPVTLYQLLQSMWSAGFHAGIADLEALPAAAAKLRSPEVLREETKREIAQ